MFPVVAPAPVVGHGVGEAPGPPNRPKVRRLFSLDENRELQDNGVGQPHALEGAGTPGTLVGANAAAQTAAGREGLLGEGAGSAAASGGTGSTGGGAAHHSSGSGGGVGGPRSRSCDTPARNSGGTALLQTATAGPALYRVAAHQAAGWDAATPANGSLPRAHTADPASLRWSAE